MLSRRRWLATATLAALLGVSGRAVAAEFEVAAPSVTVAAIVAATAGPGVAVSVDPALGAAEIRVAGAVVDVRGTILLKGDPAGQRRFLDDPRNAAKLGAGVRRALAAAYPERAAEFEANHRAWSRGFARDVLAWGARLERASVRGQRLRDPHQRVYLLEWAGAAIDAAASGAGPESLATLPEAPAAADLASYRDYVAALVAALAP